MTNLSTTLLLVPVLCGLASRPLHAEQAPSTVAVDPAVAATVLRNQLVPAEIQFQAGAYVDEDSDGRGQHGLLSELAGGTATEGDSRSPKPVQLMPAAFRGPAPVVAGWRYAVLLPGRTREQTARSIKDLAALGKIGEDEREVHWTGYAWPADGQAGNILKVGPDRMVKIAPWSGGDVLLADDRMLAGLAWSRFHPPAARPAESRPAARTAIIGLPSELIPTVEPQARILRGIAIACALFQCDNDDVQVRDLRRWKQIKVAERE